MILTDELYDFAFFFDLQGDLRELARMAMPESWAFLRPQYVTFNTETPILEKYIRTIYRYQAISYNQAEDLLARESIITFSGPWACFHTGLLTPFFQGIYALFELNRRKDTRYDWVFKGFHPAGAPKLRALPVLPRKPYFGTSDAYHPEWNIRINFAHILQDTHLVSGFSDASANCGKIYLHGVTSNKIEMTLLYLEQKWFIMFQRADSAY